MHFSEVEARWMKIGRITEFIFLNKDEIAFASGVHVIFFNLVTKDERVERFDDKERGEGASCLADHPVISVFSIAERCSNPRVLVYTYPGIRKVSSCSLNEGPNAYLSSSFAGTEYLLTLTSFPDLQMIIWLWRTGEKMTSTKTKITDELQSIRCSLTAPHLVSQIGQVTGKLAVYEITVCSKIVSFTDVEVKSAKDPFVSSCWTMDGCLILCDRIGNVYSMSGDGKKCCDVVKLDGCISEDKPPFVSTYQSGIILVDSNSKITLFRKASMEFRGNETQWKPTWTIDTVSHPIYTATHPQRNGIVCYGEKGDLFEVNLEEDHVPRIEIKSARGAGFEILEWINPEGKYVVTVDKFDQLSTIESSTGQLVGVISLQKYGRIISMVSHPKLSMTVLTTTTGECIFVSFQQVPKPSILGCINLNGNALDKIKFSCSGKTLAVASSFTGDIFFIGRRGNDLADVLGHLQIKRQIVDFLLYEDDKEDLKILVLIVTNISAIIGDAIMIYTLRTSTRTFSKEDYAIELSVPFKCLHYGPRDIFDITGTPYLTKQLHLMEIMTDFRNMTLTQGLPTAHHLRNAEINVDRCHLMTSGYDGLVVVRDGVELQKIIALFMSHHRREGGTKRTISSPSCDVIISLGRNGDVVATKLSFQRPKSAIVRQSSEQLTSSDYQGIFIDFIQRYRESNVDSSKTWVQSQEEAKLRKECEATAEMRNSIVRDFKSLRKQVSMLLDSNEKESEDVRVPLSKFDLDQEGRSRRIQEANDDRVELRRHLEDEITRRDEIAQYLRDTCWKSMMVHACTLKAINESDHVDNYPLPKTSQEYCDSQKWKEFVSTFAEEVSSFHLRGSWSPDTKTELPIATGRSGISSSREKEGRNEIEQEKYLSGSLTSMWDTEKIVNYSSDERLSNLSITRTALDCTSTEEKREEEDRYALTGTTTHKWIRDEHLRFSQLKYRNYTVDARENVIVKNQKLQLKIHFNGVFEEMRMVKEQELSLINQRIEKLRHCAAELNTMFKSNNHVELSRLKPPMWHPTENPYSIIAVEDSEVPAEPYVSPRQRECFNEESAIVRPKWMLELEDFYEEALMDMMEGVLELRWENEIKKDIPKPKCLLIKDPIDYTEEDLNAIAKYEEKFQQLEAERLKYKEQLETDVLKTKDALKSGIEVFNDRLKKFSVERMKLHSAVLQETLIMLHTTRRNLRRILNCEEIDRLKSDELEPAVKQGQKLSEEISLLEITVADLRNRYDVLSKREKLLEGKFRSEFMDHLKQPMVEHLLRHYRRRPRIGQVTCTSITFLNEIGKCVHIGEKSDVLPRECLDFLKGLDGLDVMPTSLPTQIDVNHWHLLCRLRRVRVEMEMRMRCCAVELAEAEQTLAARQRANILAQSRIAHLKEQLKERRQTQVHLMEDAEVQLVVKMSQIEIQPHGCPDDLRNAVLVPLREVLLVNDAIVKAGRVKLAAMYRSVEYRRTIQCREWLHRCMRMKLEDLRRELKVTEGVKITKEIQRYLTQYRDDFNAIKEEDARERGLQSTEQWLGKIIRAKKHRLEEVAREIAVWRRRNADLAEKIDLLKPENSSKEAMLASDEGRAREERFASEKLEAIMKRNRLTKRVQKNYNDLLALRAQLELLRLKTYPTLKLQVFDRRRTKRGKDEDRL